MENIKEEKAREYKFTEKELRKILHQAYIKGYDVRGDREHGKPTGGYNSWIDDYIKSLEK